MTRTRILILISLVVLPIVFMVGVGSYHLWTTGWTFWAWWPMGLSLGSAYFLAWRWQKGIRARQVEKPPPMHWTDRDRLAWTRVEERQKGSDSVPLERVGEAQFYFDVAQEMAKELAVVYRPDATDPMGIVTVPEILTVIELASHDLNELARTYVPGSHMMTVDNWRTARKAIDWYRKASNVYWLASAVIDPIKTATRYFAAQYGMGKPMEQFQQHAIRWFYTAYVREIGFYFIELYSGRLKVGAARYRELMAQHDHKPGEPQLDVPPADETVPDESPPSKPTTAAVTLALIGQVKAGKSSLINALLGKRKAATDILPLTNEVTRYDLDSPGIPTRLGLLDTAGYGRSGVTEDNLEATAEAVQSSDLVLLVTQARNPARKADVEFLVQLRAWFEKRPHLRFPPMLVVLTHVDLLTPAMEWSPPYDWRDGIRLKEKSMFEAIASARESFPEATGIVPCRTSAGSEWGVQEELLSEIVALLGEAKAVSLLRCLHAEADEGRVKKVFAQLWAAGRKALDVWRGVPTR
jgi:uncharacterized protein